MKTEVRDAFASSENTDWETPQDFFNLLDREFHFTFDVCADDTNFKMKPYFTAEQDAFKQVWRGTTFCNPPYGREIGKWVAENYDQAQRHLTTAVALLPARTDTGWFHEYVMRASEVRLLRGRLSFIAPTCVRPGAPCGKFATHPVHAIHEFVPGPDKAPSPALFPSMVVIFKSGTRYPLFSTLAFKSGVCHVCGDPILAGAGVHPSCKV